MRAGFLVLLAVLLALPALPGGPPGASVHPPVVPAAGAAPSPPVGSSGGLADGVAAREIQQALGSLGTSSNAPTWTCHGDPAWANNACRLPRYALAPRDAATGTGWVAGTRSPPPQADFDFEMTYDASDSVVLLLGSPAGPYGAPSSTTDFWSYHQGNWTNLQSTLPPVNCPGSSLAYDSADGYVVFLGAPDSYYGIGCPSGGTTWSYHAGLWQNLTPSPSPAPRWGASLVNDSTDGYLLLFGGNVFNCTGFTPSANCGNGYLNDTWKFSAGHWSRLTPTVAPSWRSTAGLADDPVDHYVVLFGGSTPYGVLNDTWNFTKGNWTHMNVGRSPPIPVPDGFTYDAFDGVLLYTNVYPNFNSTTAFEVTWTFTAGAWTPVTFTYGPLSRSGGEQAYDYADQYTLFFGGLRNYGGGDLNDVWSFAGGNWTNRSLPAPAARTEPMVAYDGASGKVLLFGGASNSAAGTTYLNDTWTYDASGWTLLSTPQAPGVRAGGGMVYDASDGYILLFGGHDPLVGPLNDTWEFTSAGWAMLTPAKSPPASYGQRMVYDGGDGYVLLFDNSSTGDSTFTFQSGVWTNRTSTAGTPPPGAPLNPMVYDSTDGYVLLFGTWTGSAGANNETWKFSGGRWADLTSTALHAPPPSSGAVLADYPPGGYALFWTGQPANMSWTFSGGNWSALYAPLGPSPRSGMGSAYDPNLGEIVLFGGDGASPDCSYYGPCGQTWLWGPGGPNVPSIQTFSVAPEITDMGRAVAFTVVGVGGYLPWTFSYSGLPTGCASANISVLACTPTTTGSYTVQVRLTDASGNSTSASTVLKVVPAPEANFSVSPGTITLGSPTLFTTAVYYGVAPYAYSYGGLPPGCTTQTVPALPCTPTSAGHYTVDVTVTDAVGVNATNTTPLTVLPASSSGGPSIASFNASPAALVLGNSTNLTVVASGGTAPYYYAYSGLPAGCASANLSVLPCTPTASGTYTVVVNVSDASGNGTTVGTTLTVYPAGGGAGLKVSAFGPTGPGAFVGSPFGLKVVASGGHGALSYGYTGLPPGCTSQSRSEISCTPTTAGAYRIHVTVSDTSGDRVTVPLALLVVPSLGPGGPTIAYFAPAPASIRLGATSILTVNTTGGTAPLTYRYSDLPLGCLDANTPTLPCTPNVVGSYPVHVEVLDANGLSANATTVLTVSAPASIPGTTSSGLTGTEGLLIGVALGATAVIVGSVGFWLGRRRGGLPPPEP